MIEKTFYPLPTIEVRYSGSKEINYIVYVYIRWFSRFVRFCWREKNKNKIDLPF